ncbi:MAG: hypothetical protein QOG35_2706 [Solirubrobacteraceae bacterium]|jgi:uncharacterized membrane protein|nr:hypothetical protein [Solirubrobacteraceae bacterium]
MAPKRLKAAGKALHTAEHVVGDEARHAAELLRTEPFWQAQAALIGALILYITLPTKLILGPTWLMPALELLLVVGLWIDRPRTGRATARRDRTVVLVLLAMVAVANLASLELLVHYLLHGGKAAGRPLILASIVIWLTNVAVFGLWFWQLDRGGPDRRSRGDDAKDADFLFVQMTEPAVAPGWLPTFVDYLYLSFTNATAFSPTDTMPLTDRAKLMMMGESLISLVTVLLVAARAVSVLT